MCLSETSCLLENKQCCLAETLLCKDTFYNAFYNAQSVKNMRAEQLSVYASKCM